MSTIGGIDVNGNQTIGRALMGNELEAPINQRPYRWEDKHVKELLDDLATAIGQGESEYFLGSIVVIKNETGRPRVVDGQQRLATAMILLAAIRDYFYRDDQIERAGDIERDYLMKRSLRTEDRQPKFILSNADRDYFQKRILERPDNADRILLEKQKLASLSTNETIAVAPAQDAPKRAGATEYEDSQRWSVSTERPERLFH